MEFEPITLQLHYTKDDYIKPLTIIAKNTKQRTYSALIIALVLLGCAALDIYNQVSYRPPLYPALIPHDQLLDLYDSSHSINMGVPTVLIVISLMLLASYAKRELASRLVRRYPHVLQPFELIITENGMESRRKGIHTTTEWNFITRYFEDPNFLVVMNRENTFNVIVKKYVDANKYESIKKILAEKVKQ